MPPESQNAWVTLREEPICQTPHLAVSKETIATPSRPQGVDWFVVHRPQATVVAPRLRNGNYVLIRQERAAVRLLTWEFPAGQRDGNGESVEETALRELAEEAGLVCCGALLPLGWFYSSVGFTDENCELFLATDCEEREGIAAPDEHEAITGMIQIPPDRLLAMIADCEILDSNTLCACARLMAKGLFYT